MVLETKMALKQQATATLAVVERYGQDGIGPCRRKSGQGLD